MKPLLPLLTLVALAPALLPAQSAPLQSTVIESDGPGEMVSTDLETTITFRDNVRATGTNLRLTCDYLEVVVIRSGDKSATLGKIDKFRSMLATGHVHIVQDRRDAACGRADVLPEQEMVILTDHPVIVDHDQDTRIAGEKITLFRGQRKVEVEKPLLTAPPIKDLGVDQSPAPAAAPAAAPKKP